MKFTQAYLDHSQKVITEIFKGKRAELIAANGNVDSQFKDDKSVVTKHDQEMESELKAALSTLDPGVGFEGEEYGAEGNRETFWLVDPIDGTESFVRGLPFFRNMATLIDAGKPVLALVYRVITDELFVAKKGGGTSKNGTKLTISQRPLSRTRIELANKPSIATAPLLEEIDKHIENFRTSDEFLFTVEAKMDAHFVYKESTKPWDNAPRMLLLEEAGAKVANLGSSTYDYTQSNWLAANPIVFDQLTAIIDKFNKV